ncbi:MAG: SRPBCC family protein [Phenylobacterium sp.]
MTAKTDTFRVERSTIVSAKPEVIFPLIDDFHRWVDWSPFEKLDANLEKTFSGPARGKGAAYAWNGKKAGAGRMEILISDKPSRIVIQLDFSKPMIAHNTAEFTLEPQGGGTKVNWAMTGPHTLMSKVMHLVFPMDKMVGPQFAEGLASLKRIAEGASVAA